MTRIKICGLTQADDVDLAVELGAHLLGFICVPKSPRFVPIDTLRKLLKRTEGKAERCLVVQNLSEEDLASLRDTLSFEHFQFHGDEPAHYPKRWGGYKVAHMGASRPNLHELAHYGKPYLLDTAVGEQRGGTGKTFDWSVLPDMPSPFLVAGGLNADNVAELIRTYRPWGVDVSSGIEANPGKKDHGLMNRFFENARRATA